MRCRLQKEKFLIGAIPGICGLEIETEGSALELSMPTMRNLLGYSETLNQIRRCLFRERMIPNPINRSCLKIEGNTSPRKRRQCNFVQGHS
jgi:hypothetical protein